ncbi:hypothetical protein G7046_g7153 [Stylonectria norvegica]|nr:hypothetical protein G7046_g7153 [Stylonectria norvegica]
MTARFFDCSVPQCKKPAISDDAAYTAQTVAEIERLCSRIDNAALCRLASELNGGKTCDIEHFTTVGPDALMGSANYHVRIRFHDGSPSWLLRVPRVASCAVGLPPSLADYLITSEYATLKFLETTKVPAPRAFGCGVCSDGTDRGVGVSFLLMEELPGRPWSGEGTSGDDATEEEKKRIWGSVADILAELEKHPFPKAGSLCLGSCGIEVSAVASDRFVVLTPEGPVETPVSYYTAFAEQYLTLIADKQLYTEYPVDAYLVYRFLKDNAAQLVPDEDTESMPQQFFLKHVDDKGDHLLVNDKLEVTGIIDWQMARVVPRREAFGPSLVTADMRALCGGQASLCADDHALAVEMKKRGSPELAAWMSDEKARRFFWGLALETKWAFALPLANAILKTFGVEKGWDEWREAALKEYGTDERLMALVHEQSPAFS